MPATENIVMASGGLAFIGSFKEEGGFPSNGYSVIGATTVLVFLASTVRGGALDKPLRMLAYLMLISAAMRYVPGLATTTTETSKRKRKNNG